MKKLISKAICIALCMGACHATEAQTIAPKKASAVLWDGMAVGGYVNKGGFVNFGGPTVKLLSKPFSFGFGILPTMRIKEDNVPKGAKKNSSVMPTAGFGFTFVYKHLVLQVPFYYNAKTTTSDGKWFPGIGAGFKF